MLRQHYFTSALRELGEVGTCSLIHKRGNRSTERLGDLPEGTQLENTEVRIPTQVHLSAKSLLLITDAAFQDTWA